MSNAELLAKVKDILMINTDGMDMSLLPHVLAAQNYLLNAGVSEEYIATDAGVMAVAVGANDLWNMGAGAAEFSSAFHIMVKQLQLISLEVPDERT